VLRPSEIANLTSERQQHIQIAFTKKLDQTEFAKYLLPLSSESFVFASDIYKRKEKSTYNCNFTYGFVWV
jgi:hypothetical protein